MAKISGNFPVKRPGLIILGVLVGLNILAWLAVANLSGAQNLEVVFFDVGQGDSIFIETLDSQQILIDGGPDSTIIKKLGKEMPFWDRKIELLILTHPEHDHYGGLLEVLKRYQVENILWTGVKKETAEYQEWKRLIKREKAETYTAKKGQEITVGAAILKVLHPSGNLEGDRFVGNINNTSIVSRLTFKGKSFLFTGDIYKSVEGAVLLSTDNKSQVASDVLKVSHHGSKTSSAKEFIKAVSPEIAVIQCGKDNYYNHPHAETLETLEKYGIKVFRTDKKGDIKITVN